MNIGNKDSQMYNQDLSQDVIEHGEPSFDLLSKDEIDLINSIFNKVQLMPLNNPSDMMHVSQFWGYLSYRIYRQRGEYITELGEVEKQKLDLEHRLPKMDKNSDEYINTLRDIGDIVCKRRIIKDFQSYLGTLSTNIHGVSKFVRGMTQRVYTPRSNKYGTSDDPNTTKVKVTFKNDSDTPTPSHIYKKN